VRYVVVESEHDEIVTAYTNAVLEDPGVTKHPDPEPMPGPPCRAHRRLRGLADAVERSQSAERQPPRLLPGKLHEIRGWASNHRGQASCLLKTRAGAGVLPGSPAPRSRIRRRDPLPRPTLEVSHQVW
jgi:hypothetical protein